MQRRTFLKHTATGIAGAWALSSLPQALFAQAPGAFKDIPLGFQAWPVRDLIAKDFAATMKMMAELGYKKVEMCSPKGYEKTEFGTLIGIKPADLRNVITDAGLTCPSSHFGMGEFADENIDASIEFAKGMGLSHMICSSFGLPKTATLKDYLAAADKLNKAAVKVKAAGMQTGFHNHSAEFEKLDGQIIYDELLKRFDAKLVRMQFQTEVINLGFKGPDYFKEYPGRFVSAHLSDWTADKKSVPLGKGVIEWKEFFAAGEKAGIETYFVEMNLEEMKGSLGVGKA